MRMVALTNSTQPVAEAQLASAGLGQHFEAVISADSVRHLKPVPQRTPGTSPGRSAPDARPPSSPAPVWY
jgi:hypothetical protein